jgi:hypothetical protein
MMQPWWQEICRFWSMPRVVTNYSTGFIPPNPIETVSPQGSTPGLYPYFWFHYLFGYCLETSADFKNTWAECAKISAIPTLNLQNLIRSTPNPTQEQFMEALKGSPVQKLDWRLSYKIASDSVVAESKQ